MPTSNTAAACAAYRAKVLQDGKALNMIPSEHITADLLEIGILNGFDINFCTTRMHYEAIEYAIKRNGMQIGTLLDVFEDLCVPECLLLSAVRQNGLALEPIAFFITPTAKVCLAAVKQNGLAIRFVPEKKMSKRIMFAAIKECWHALELIPENLIDEDLIDLAIEVAGPRFKCPANVPEDLKAYAILKGYV